MDFSHPDQIDVNSKVKVPLCVDLDGTLVKTDMYWESFLLLLKRNVLYIFVLPFWVIKGKAYCKSQIAARVSIDVSILPYHPSFLNFLKAEWKTGRQVVLATGTDCQLARKISNHLGIFSKVFASEGGNNLTGKRKMQTLKRKYGKGGFDYAGNSTVDLPIWENAQCAIVVSSSGKLIEAVRRVTFIRTTFPGNQGACQKLLQAFRPSHWVTNILVAVPLFTTYPLIGSITILKLLFAFVAFSCVGAGVYVLSDLFDLQDDRRNSQKEFRAFAAGEVPLVWGLIMVPVLILVALGISWFLPLAFQLNLWVFVLVAIMDTLFFKSHLASHIIGLAGLYTLRVTGGAAAIEMPMSSWFLTFPLFLILSFAWMKRKAMLSRNEVRC